MYPQGIENKCFKAFGTGFVKADHFKVILDELKGDAEKLHYTIMIRMQ